MIQSGLGQGHDVLRCTARELTAASVESYQADI
jgi:hypothetical protein